MRVPGSRLQPLFLLKQRTIKLDAGVYVKFIHGYPSSGVLLEVRELVKPLGLHNQRYNHLIEQASVIADCSGGGILWDREGWSNRPALASKPHEKTS